MCCKKSVLKNCQIVTGKTLVLQSLFNKAGLQAFRCFLVNNEKVLRANLLKEHLRTAASEGSFYVKKNKLSFLSYQNSNRSERKISMSVFTVLFSFSRSYQ